MKQWITTAAAIALIAGISTANAQNAPAATNNKDDKAMEQSSKTDASKTAASKTKQHASVKKHKVRHKASMRSGATTGAGDRAGPIGGPKNDPSIHQSIQRDSRGTPKGPGSDYNK
jgi:hypothetical protein